MSFLWKSRSPQLAWFEVETRDRRLGIKLRFSNYGSVTTLQQPRPSNYASATAAQQPNYPLASTTTLQQLRFNNQNPLSLQQPNLSNQNSPPPWRVHASYHNPTPLASTCEDCEVTSYTINIRPPLATSAKWTPTMTSVPGALGPWSMIPGMASGDWRNSERFAWEQDPLSEISRDRISP